MVGASPRLLLIKVVFLGRTMSLAPLAKSGISPLVSGLVTMVPDVVNCAFPVVSVLVPSPVLMVMNRPLA